MKRVIQKIKLLQNKARQKLLELSSTIPDYLSYQFTGTKGVNQPTIVFAGTYMHARIARMAKWLNRSTTYDVHLICSKNGYLDKLSNDSFSKVSLFRNKWHLKHMLKSYNGKDVILHTFGPPHLGAYEVVKSACTGKKIFDYQDLMITNFGFHPPFHYMKKDLVKEEYILKNVSAIVNHSLELQVAKQHYGKIVAEKMFFPNYTDNDYFIDKKVNTSDELHIVYAGGVYSAFRNSDYFGGMQLHWLIEKMNHQKVHFHIYPAPTNAEENLADYIELDEKLEYFHLHESVKQEDLSKELSQYDYGVLPFFNRRTKIHDEKRVYSTTLKLFNFFEAGIPVLIGEDLIFQNFIGAKFEGALVAKWEDFDNIKQLARSVDYQELVEKIKKNRERYSLNANISRLAEFYKNLD